MKQPKMYMCLQCRVDCVKTPQNKGKYCSNACQREFEYHTKIKPSIERGEVTTDSTLKKYLIREREYKCEVCGQEGEWAGKPLSLQLDHIDGNSDNGMPCNLRLICPNCHTQTDTFGSKGCGNRYKKITKRNEYLRSYRKVEAG